MIEIVRKENCSGCSACSQVCPQRCITMKADEEGFLYPIINKPMCIGCNRCDKACPVLSKRYANLEEWPKAYLCYEKEEQKRIDSAAGGAFFSLAKGFIEKYHGVVFGAAYDIKFNVRHVAVDSISDLNNLQKSKYVQSEIGSAYKLTIEMLKGGRYVLFSGTTCQIAGLKRCVPQNLQDNLYTVDLSCYGVPSPTVFNEYIAYQEKKNGQIENMIIRDKKLYRKLFRVGYGIQFKNGKKYFAPHGIDPMARIFYSHIALRPICYNCPFKTIGRISDITLGDCWYADELIPNFVDRIGITMLLMHSSKAKELVKMADTLEKYPVDSEKVIKVNGGMIFNSSERPSNRDEFFEIFRQHAMSFDNLANIYVPARKDSLKYKLALILKELGLFPAFIQRRKRKAEIIKRCKKNIPESALKIYK